jgi:hypothetical protein
MEIIIFKATEEHLLEIGALAVNAAEPVGMGYLHYVEGDYKPEDLRENLEKDGSLYIDYFRGRITKLYIQKIQNETYRTRNDLNTEYQSFGKLYKDFKALIDTVEGIQIIQKESYFSEDV